MASVRAGRDARGAMNDLPIPGDPDFDLNTMKLTPPASQAPAPANAILGPLAGSPEVNNIPPPKVAPTPPPMDQQDVSDLTNQRLLNILGPDPNDPMYQATPVTGGQQKAVGAGGGGGGGALPSPPPPIPMLKPGSDPAQTIGGGGGGIPSMRQQQADVIRNQINAGHLDPSVGQKQLQIIKSLPGGDQVDISVHPPADSGGFDLGKWAVRLGVPLAVAAMLFRHKIGGSAAELAKMFDLGGSTIAPDLTKVTPVMKDLPESTAYPDNTVANATDEARKRVNDAYGGQAPSVDQEVQDKLAALRSQTTGARQADIDSGKIAPQDYQQGEKPKPGTEGYKAWFKYRQAQARNRVSR